MTLKQIASEIEKKNGSIEKLKRFIFENPNCAVTSEFRSMLAKTTKKRDELQVQLDKQYELYN